MNRLATTGMLVVVSLFCVSVHGGSLPPWINVLPKQTQHLYAVGAAPLDQPEAQAIRAAGQNAKLELLMTLRTSVKSSLNSSDSLDVFATEKSATAKSSKQLRQNSTISTSARDLPGLHIAESFVDRENESVYALAELDLAAAQQDLARRQLQLGVQLQKLRTLVRADFTQLAGTEKILRANDELLDIAGLLTASISNDRVAQISGMHDEYIELLAKTRKENTFGVDVSVIEADAVQQMPALMSAVTQAGYSWSENPRYRFVIRNVRQLQANYAYGKQIAKSSLELLMLDEEESVLKSSRIVATGTGSTELQAGIQLEKQFAEKIAVTINEWLSNDLASDTPDELTPGSSDKPFRW